MVEHIAGDVSVVAEAQREQAGDLLAALAAREILLAESEAVVARLRQELTAAESVRLAAEERSAAADRELTALRATLSWRVTQPLRAVRRLTGGASR